MALRQSSSLKELQARLAQRLQAATQGQTDVGASWLAVECGGSHFLCPLEQAGGLFAWGGVQAVPYTRPWFLGVANLRGTLTGVVDLPGLLLGANPVRSERGLAESSLLALNATLEVNAALLVDRLAGLRGAEAFVATESAADGAPSYFGGVYLDEGGTRWQELDLHALSLHPTFLSISV